MACAPKPVWSKQIGDGNFWSTASLSFDSDKGFVFHAQEYRTYLSVELTLKDAKRLHEFLGKVLENDRNN